MSVDYAQSLLEYLNLFKAQTQHNRIESIGLTYLGDCCKDGKLFRQGVLQQLICIESMIEESIDNEDQLTVVGIIMSSHFYVKDMYFDDVLAGCLGTLDNLFVHNLSLPAHHCGYTLQSDLIREIKSQITSIKEHLGHISPSGLI